MIPGSEEGVRVRVKLFALYRELVGEKEVEVSLPEGSRVRDLLRALEESYPSLRGRLSERSGERRSFILMRGGRWPDMDDELRDGDEFALFPPVGGG